MGYAVARHGTFSATAWRWPATLRLPGCWSTCSPTEATATSGTSCISWPAPITALIARLSRALLGDSLDALRFLPGLAGAAKILLTGLDARELGAGRGAGLWPVTPASVPALNPMAARMPPWPAESPRHAGCSGLLRLAAVYQFVLAILLDHYPGFRRVNQLCFIARDSIADVPGRDAGIRLGRVAQRRQAHWQTDRRSPAERLCGPAAGLAAHPWAALM